MPSTWKSQKHHDFVLDKNRKIQSPPIIYIHIFFVRPTILFLKGSVNLKISLCKNLVSAELIHSQSSRSNTKTTETCTARILYHSEFYQSLPEVALDSPNSRRSQNYHQIFTIPNILWPPHIVSHLTYLHTLQAPPTTSQSHKRNPQKKTNKNTEQYK